MCGCIARKYLLLQFVYARRIWNIICYILYLLAESEIFIVTCCICSKNLKYSLLHFVSARRIWNIHCYILYLLAESEIFIVTFCICSKNRKYSLLQFVSVHRIERLEKENEELKTARDSLKTRLTVSVTGFLLQVTLDISKLWGLFFTSSNYPKCKLIWLRVIWTCKKVSDAKLWLEKAIKMYFWFI